MDKSVKHASEIYLKFCEMVSKEGRYPLDAYPFVLNALQYTISSLPKPRHVSGRELAFGIRDYALESFGPMAGLVLNHWNIQETLDFGKIVFALIDANMLLRTEDDALEDFRKVFSFSDAFGGQYEPDLDQIDLRSPKGVIELDGPGS